MCAFRALNWCLDKRRVHISEFGFFVRGFSVEDTRACAEESGQCFERSACEAGGKKEKKKMYVKNRKQSKE